MASDGATREYIYTVQVRSPPRAGGRHMRWRDASAAVDRAPAQLTPVCLSAPMHQYTVLFSRPVDLSTTYTLARSLPGGSS